MMDHFKGTFILLLIPQTLNTDYTFDEYKFEYL